MSREMNKEIEDAISVANRAQRNYDRTKPIKPEDLETMIHACKYAPSKQNETHYKVLVIQDEDLIYKIYKKTNHFTLYKSIDDLDWSGRGINEKFNITNSQVLAKVLFAFCDDWDHNRTRAGVHLKSFTENPDPSTIIEREKQRHFSMGIASGMVALSATLLGYKTGYCTAFHPRDVEPHNGLHGYPGLGLSNILEELSHCEILLGVGHGDPNKNRREHAELLNKDIPVHPNGETSWTGKPDEKWIFNTTDKKIDLKII